MPSKTDPCVLDEFVLVLVKSPQTFFDLPHNLFRYISVPPYKSICFVIFIYLHKTVKNSSLFSDLKGPHHKTCLTGAIFCIWWKTKAALCATTFYHCTRKGGLWRG